MEKYKLPDGRILKIMQDEDAESPRTWDNLGKMLIVHSRYNMGDRILESTDYINGEPKRKYRNAKQSDIEEYMNYNEETDEYEGFSSDYIIAPISMYDHSDISLSLNRSYPFNDKWDVSMVGIMVISREDARKEFEDMPLDDLRDKVMKIWSGEIKTYNQYLCGDVWGFSLSSVKKCEHCGNEEEIEEDSCWGFFGDPEESGLLEYAGVSLEDWRKAEKL